MRELPEIYTQPIARATIGDQLRRLAANEGAKVAVVTYSADGERSAWTYRRLNALANRWANALAGWGVGRGDKVMAMSRNRIDVIGAYFGALKVGAAYSGINPMFTADEVAYQVNHLEPTVLIAEAEAVDVIEACRADLGPVRAYVGLDPVDREGWTNGPEALDAASETEPDAEVDELDLAMIVYTSGTEAFPKGVMIPHRNYLISTAPAWSWGVDTGPRDTWLFVMPFHTIAGLGSMTTLLLVGATIVLPSGTDPAHSLQLIRDESITVLAQTPTFYLALTQHDSFGPDAVASVRRCMTYGGMVLRSVVDAWADAGNDELMWGTYWGQSELSQLGSVGWFRRLEEIPGADPAYIGKPVGHLEISVRDAAGHPAEVGQLWCRTPSVMLGYYKDPERTAEVMRDGWVHTGDMVRRDEHGNLFFYDRIKDVIKTGGYNVSSQEVERVVMGVTGVERCAVVGLTDEKWSEVVAAVIIRSEGSTVTEEDVLTECRRRLASFKVPKRVAFVDSLPTDAQGKILKRRIRTSL